MVGSIENTRKSSALPMDRIKETCHGFGFRTASKLGHLTVHKTTCATVSGRRD